MKIGDLLLLKGYINKKQLQEAYIYLENYHLSFYTDAINISKSHEPVFASA